MREDLLKALNEPTVDAALAGKILGVSRNTAYKAVKAGEIPSIRVGSQFRVPTTKLREMLGLPAFIFSDGTNRKAAA